ncbi:hypothetical protein [Streptomyces erythrochromogenes]|nr:hypothetical protein OG489_23020 [Streptomyces erythrochromogenes]
MGSMGDFPPLVDAARGKELNPAALHGVTVREEFARAVPARA